METVTKTAARLKPFMASTAIEVVIASRLTTENKITLYNFATTGLTYFEKDSSGFDLASATAVSGDVILLPACTIDGDHTLTAGVAYVGLDREMSILSGQITLENDTTLDNLTIILTGTDTNVKGVIGQISGEARIYDCNISATATSGNASAVYTNSDGDIKIYSSNLSGVSDSGIGVAIELDGFTGDVYQYHGTAHGSSGMYSYS